MSEKSDLKITEETYRNVHAVWDLAVDLFTLLVKTQLVMACLQYVVTTLTLRAARGDKDRAKMMIDYLCKRSKVNVDRIRDVDGYPGDGYNRVEGWVDEEVEALKREHGHA